MGKIKNLYSDPKLTFGRDKIFAYEPITSTSIIRIVKSSLPTHEKNAEDIAWNFRLYKGNDSRIAEKKQVSDINHKVIVSQESSIVDVKSGLLTQNPVTLLNAGDRDIDESISELSTMYRVMNKHRIDKECAGQAGICGTSYVFIEKDEKYRAGVKNGHYPFKKSILNPESVFPLWQDESDSEPVAMVYITNEMHTDGRRDMCALKKRYTVYTDDFTYTFLLEDSEPVVTKAMPWGIPIVEKYCNPYRIGFFERVESLIYARSVLRSDEMTNVSSFVNAIWYIWGINMPEVDPESDEETQEMQRKALNEFLRQIKEKRMIWNPEAKTKDESGLQLIGSQLDNNGTKILDDTLKNDIVAIAKIPDYVGEIGGSGNGIAAQTASGWLPALLDAIDQEPYWFEGIKKELYKDLTICQSVGLLMDLSIEDIALNIQRKTFEDKQSATQSFATLISTGVPYEDALDITNITPDAHNLADKMLKWREMDIEPVKAVEEDIIVKEQTDE